MTGQIAIPVDLAHAPFLRDAAVGAVIRALEPEAGPTLCRFVGGCVRDALLGRPLGDIDLATSLPPDEVMARARGAGLEAVPTGLAHGTVTLVFQGRPIEVTTLRADVETFGRHATVQFTEDWAGDAGRRDFTINAIYADRHGQLFDPVGGREDLSLGRVRFIGNAEDRIREDYLRILRFFRIHAWYGRGAPDAPGLAAAARLAEGLKSLSAERVQKELLRLLAAPDPVPVLNAMAGAGCLALLLPEAGPPERLSSLVRIERHYLQAVDGLRRLARLIEATPEMAAGIAHRLRLSNKELERLRRLKEGAAPITPEISRAALNELLYRGGIDAVCDSIVMSWAAMGEAVPPEGWLGLHFVAKNYLRPRFPIGGHDLMKLGAAGATIGQAMRALEELWIASEFRLSKEELMAKAPGLIGAGSG